jgi:hypothetical protein
MKIGNIKPEEVCLDTDAITDILHMYRHVPAIKVSRESFLSMTLCGPFSFSIPKLGLTNNADMEQIISRYWMTWQRAVYDWIKMIGICPYYMKKINSKSQHQIPVVPSIELGYITVTVNKKHELEYNWYWNHGNTQELEKSMLWVISDHAPTCDGTIRSPLASLLTHYRTILILQRSLEICSDQRAKPTHVLEYTPSAETAKNDHLTTLVAGMGERAAGMSKARQEMARNQDIRVRTAELFKQMAGVQTQNVKSGLASTSKLLWTDTPLEQVERADPGFATRTIPLQPDFHYVQTSKPEIIADLDKHMSSFNMIASAVMDFALELIQPTGSARTQNVKGSERFENERIKASLSFFSDITRTALIIAYRKQFQQGFDQAKSWVNKKGGDANHVADMYPELDVQVDMSCTPMVEYSELKELWMDGILSKDDFAAHAFHLLSLPHEQISITTLPDRFPKELIIKPDLQPKAKKAKTSK